jgi:hypothetical protein
VSAVRQFELNMSCIVKDLTRLKFKKALFHCQGLKRAIFQLIFP